MELEIENFRGIKHAKVTLSNKITLIGGRVGSGKSSTMQTLKALVTQDTTPIEGLKKKDAAILVRNDQKSARASLAWSGGKCEIKWPACKLTGPTMQCSKYAAGLAVPVNIEATELSKIIGVLPAKEDYDAEMAVITESHPDQAGGIEQLWKAIETKGWDAVFKQVTEIGRDLKRDWEKLSGQNWGSEVATKWFPEHFTGKPFEELEMSLKTAEKMHEYTIKSQALSDKEREDLQALAATADSAASAAGDLNKQHLDVLDNLAKAKALLKELPKIVNQQQAYECWNCGQPGMVHEGKFVQAPDVKQTQEDAAAAQLRIQQQQELIDKLQAEANSLSVAMKTTQAHADKCREAQRKVNSIVKTQEPQPVFSVEDARSEVELCRKQMAAHKVKTECDEIRDLLGGNSYVVGVLAPDGLRKQVLATKLASFNELLGVICEIAEWPAIALDEFLDVRFDGRPYVMLSTGQQYMVNVVLQVAFAKLDKSEIVIIDEARVLDGSFGEGLFAILQNIPIPSVVGHTFKERSEVPDLSAHELGSSFWCEAGSVQELYVKVTA